MTVAAVGHDHVVAEDAFMPGSEGGDGALRLQIAVVSLEGYPDRSQLFEGMLELEGLRFHIDARALPGGATQVPPISRPRLRASISM